MSLPKRDGVKGRYYLIHKPDTSPEVLAEAVSFPAAAEGISLRGCGFPLRCHAAAGLLGGDSL